MIDSKKKLRFIINRNAGKKFPSHLPALIDQCIDKNQFETDVFVTETADEAIQRTEEAKQQHFYAVIAAGGDGTYNVSGSVLKNSETALGLLPAGSGNGLAFHFGITMDLEREIRAINHWKIRKIDSLLVNNQFGLNVSGAGFDAHIVTVFNRDKTKRGFGKYMGIAIREFLASNNFDAEISIDGIQFSSQAWWIAFANSTRYANLARIAPLAKADDGLIDLTVIKKIPALKFPYHIYLLFTGKILRSKSVTAFKSKTVNLKFSHEVPWHIDGELQSPVKEITVEIIPASVNLLLPL